MTFISIKQIFSEIFLKNNTFYQFLKLESFSSPLAGDLKKFQDF